MISIKEKIEIILSCFSQTKLSYLIEVYAILKKNFFDLHENMAKIARNTSEL
jgi:hypothetical protein